MTDPHATRIPPALLSRRLVLAGIVAGGAAAATPRIDAPTGPALANPLVRQRADVQIFRHVDGLYYMTGSVPEYDRLILRRSPSIAGLATATETVLWRRPKTGKLGGYIWAPELHAIDGRWYMYFAAGDTADPFHIRTYVLAADGRDAPTARWSVLGQLQTPWDTFTLDSTSFVHRGTRYLCWAQKEPGIDTNSNLYLAPLVTPTTMAQAPVRLSVPTLPWEVQGFKVNEAPALLARNGRLFLAYSASATDARYCLGLLTADADADIMDAKSWTKSPQPVFVSSAATGVYGPGHNSFTTDARGRDLLVYHGRDYAAIKGDPLFDPNRHTRVQRLYFRGDGSPDFGVPVGNGVLPDRLSPTDRPGLFLHAASGSVMVGGGPLAESQFRQVPGPAGAGTIALEPILQRGRYLQARPDGTLAIAGPDGTAATARSLSFRPRPGSGTTSFATLDGRGLLGLAHGRARILPDTASTRAATRFRLT